MPENWSGRLEIVSAIDGRVTQPRRRALPRSSRAAISIRRRRASTAPDIIALKVRTRQSRIEIAAAARTRVFRDRPRDPGRPRDLPDRGLHPAGARASTSRQGEPVRVEKLVALYTSRDRAITEPLRQRGAQRRPLPGLRRGARRATRRAWEELWDVCDVRVPERAARAVPAAPAHLPRPAGLLAPDRPPRRRRARARAQRRGVPRPRVLGRALRLSVPQLPAARRSRAACCCTATGASARRARRRPGGRLPRRDVPLAERQRRRRRRPRSSTSTRCRGRWEPDLSRNQRHVNAAIFYNIWQYYQATDDVDFLRDYGAEMMLEIARFWASIAHFNPARERWEIHGVMGPDEFHEKYPGATEGGLRNNAYTNVMVAWICDDRAGGARPAAREPARRAARGGPASPTRRSATWERDEPPDVRPLPRATASSASSRATRSSRSSTGTATARATATSSASTGSCAPRATTPTATSSPSRPTR